MPRPVVHATPCQNSAIKRDAQKRGAQRRKQYRKLKLDWNAILKQGWKEISRYGHGKYVLQNHCFCSVSFIFSNSLFYLLNLFSSCNTSIILQIYAALSWLHSWKRANHKCKMYAQCLCIPCKNILDIKLYLYATTNWHVWAQRRHRQGRSVLKSVPSSSLIHGDIPAQRKRCKETGEYTACHTVPSTLQCQLSMKCVAVVTQQTSYAIGP